MKKIYVLDTNVLIQASYALKCFEDNEVVLPLVVLEELDTHKRDEGERGANVREAIRMIEQIREQGDLTKGIRMDNGGMLRIEKNFKDVHLPQDLAEYKSDNRTLFGFCMITAFSIPYLVFSGSKKSFTFFQIFTNSFSISLTQFYEFRQQRLQSNRSLQKF